MRRKIADVNIGYRMYEEAMRIFNTPTVAAQKMGCDRKVFYEWAGGGAPSALFLARMDAFGGDVVYVLTGRKA